jgi:hypothetical protein
LGDGGCGHGFVDFSIEADYSLLRIERLGIRRRLTEGVEAFLTWRSFENISDVRQPPPIVSVINGVGVQFRIPALLESICEKGMSQGY